MSSVHPSVLSCWQLSRQKSSFRPVSPAGRDDWTLVLHFSWPLFPSVMKHRDIVHSAHYMRTLFTVHITLSYRVHTLHPGIYCRLKAGNVPDTALLEPWIKRAVARHIRHTNTCSGTISHLLLCLCLLAHMFCILIKAMCLYKTKHLHPDKTFLPILPADWHDVQTRCRLPRAC